MERGTSFNLTQVCMNTGDNKVMFNMGSGQHSGPRLGKLPESLRSAGHDPREVDIGVILHRHIDYVGGLLKLGGYLGFPSAEYIMDRTEYEFLKEATLETPLLNK